MYYFMPILIIAVSIIVYWRKRHIQYHTLDFRYKLFRLRDDLRFQAINNKIDKDNWAFKYLDSSLSITINEAYYITLSSIIAYGLIHESNKGLTEFRRELGKEISKNSELIRIEEEYKKAIKEYVLQQDHVFFVVINPIFKSIHVFNNLSKKFENWIGKVTTLPETSASKNTGYLT